MSEKVIVALTAWTVLEQVCAIVLRYVSYEITGTKDIDTDINVAVSGVVYDVGANVEAGDPTIVVVSNVVAYGAVHVMNDPPVTIAVSDVVAYVRVIAYLYPYPITEGKYPLDLAIYTTTTSNTDIKVPDRPVTDDYVSSLERSKRDSNVSCTIVPINRESI